MTSIGLPILQWFAGFEILISNTVTIWPQCLCRNNAKLAMSWPRFYFVVSASQKPAPSCLVARQSFHRFLIDRLRKHIIYHLVQWYTTLNSPDAQRAIFHSNFYNVYQFLKHHCFFSWKRVWTNLTTSIIAHCKWLSFLRSCHFLDAGLRETKIK